MALVRGVIAVFDQLLVDVQRVGPDVDEDRPGARADKRRWPWRRR